MVFAHNDYEKIGRTLFTEWFTTILWSNVFVRSFKYYDSLDFNQQNTTHFKHTNKHTKEITV